MKRRSIAVLLGTSLFLGLAANAQAQDPGTPEKEVRLKAKEGGYKVTELFESINAATGKSILYDPKAQQLQTLRVEFIGDAVIPESKLFEWLQAVLSYHNLVLVPVGPKNNSGDQQWFAMDAAKPALQSRPVYVEEQDIDQYADRDGLYVVTSIKLEYISDTSRVRSALSQLSTRTAAVGKVVDIPGSRSIIVADFAPMVAAVYRLIKFIDADNPVIEPQMEVIELEYAVASEMEPIISELIDQSTTGRGPTRQPRQPNPQTSEEPEPKIIADDRLDSLIVYATESYRKKIKELVKILDRPGTARSRLNFITLKHTDADKIGQLLEDLIAGISNSTSGSARTTTRRSSGGRAPAAPAGGTANAPLGSGLNDGDPVIIADNNSNSLIIHASPTQFESIRDLIEKLDKSRPQVMIETALVELAINDQLDLAAELFGANGGIGVDTNNDGTPDKISNDTNPFGVTNLGGLGDNVTTDVNGISVPVSKSPLFGTGALVGIFKNGKLPLLMSLYQSNGKAKIVTMPSVVTNDNMEATLELTRETSFRESTRTDSGTDRDTFNTVSATTTLTISPHISSDNYLRLEIDQSVESFGTRPSPDAPPDSTTRHISTNVTIPDKATVVLGGLIQEEERSVVEKVPFLGDIPLIGFFFRSTSDQSSPQHLFLFVTPQILRNDDDFADYTNLTRDRKLLLDDLIGEKVDLIGSKFRDPVQKSGSAIDLVRRVEESGELDGGKPKSTISTEMTQEEAEREFRKRTAAPPPPSSEPPTSESPDETPPSDPPAGSEPPK